MKWVNNVWLVFKSPWEITNTQGSMPNPHSVTLSQQGGRLALVSLAASSCSVNSPQTAKRFINGTGLPARVRSVTYKKEKLPALIVISCQVGFVCAAAFKALRPSVAGDECVVGVYNKTRACRDWLRTQTTFDVVWRKQHPQSVRKKLTLIPKHIRKGS